MLRTSLPGDRPLLKAGLGRPSLIRITASAGLEKASPNALSRDDEPLNFRERLCRKPHGLGAIPVRHAGQAATRRPTVVLRPGIQLLETENAKLVAGLQRIHRPDDGAPDQGFMACKVTVHVHQEQDSFLVGFQTQKPERDLVAAFLVQGD